MRNNISLRNFFLYCFILLGVGQVWGDERAFDGTEYIYWKVAPSSATWWNDNSASHYIQLKYNDGEWKWTNWQQANNVTDGWARWLVPSGSYWDIQLKTTNGNNTTGVSAMDGETSHNIIYDYGKDYTIFSWSQSYFAHNAYVYFDNTTANWSTTYKSILIGRDGTSNAYTLSQFANTQLWYYSSAITYYDFTQLYFIGTTGDGAWGNESSTPSSRISYATKKTSSLPKLMDYSNRTYNLFISGSETDGVNSLTHSAYSTYTSLNSVQTLNSVVRVPGGTYSSGNTKAAISLRSYSLTAATTCTQQDATLSTSESSKTISACRTATTTFTAAEATGYTFDGWYTDANDGSQLEDDASYTYYPTAATTIYARWTANTYTIILDQQTGAAGYGTSGSVTSKTATYNQALPSIGGTMPVAATGYKFQGYYTGTNGSGIKYYNADGTSAHTWDIAEDTRLYAYFEKAEITALTFDPVTTGTGTSVTVTPTISPTPAGTVYVCWGLYYDEECTEEVLNSGSPWTFADAGGSAVTFTTPGATGAYYVRAVMKTTGCGVAGDTISSFVRQYVVSAAHTVTIRHMCGSIVIHDTTQVIIAAGGTQTATAFTGDDVFGYQFSSWTISNTSGITRTDGGAENATNITISAVYDGTITANYDKKKYVYLDASQVFGSGTWTDPYAYLYNSSGYWDNEKGAGATGANCIKKGAMTAVPDTTGLWYFDYSDVEGSFGYKLAFTWGDGTGHDNFNGKEGIYRTDMNAGTPMFVPVVGQTAETKSWSGNSNNYYSKGYWRAYEPATGKTGYTLKVYDRTGSIGRKEMRSRAFTETAVEGKIFEATVDLEANTTYGIKFIRDNDQRYTNAGQTLSNGSSVTFSVRDDSEAAVSLTTTTAGDYKFTLACTSGGELTLQVDFPASLGDYRIVYKDTATWTTENGAHTGSWIHPSRIISKVNGRKDTVSFYINKDASPQIKIQHITGVNPITWDNVIGFTSIPESIKSKGTGVYNFIFQQENNSISLIKIEPYTGNYYIRVDCAGSTKWSDYQADDHKMTYSEYAANKTGSEYTHYYMKFVASDGDYKNVKFTIANDYSPCISDTLAQQSSDISPNHVNSGGDLQESANIRFMWDSRSNRLKRVYMAGGQDDGSRFLVLQGRADSLLNADGNALTGYDKEHPGNNKGGGANAIQFSDKQNWVYEATVKARPGGKIKLYARFHGVDQYFIGASPIEDWTTTSAYDVLISGSGDPELIRVIYDFKTDRLLAAWVPSGTIGNGETKEINADIMLIRRHQESGQQINLVGTGKIQTDNKKVYGVMQFNKYVLNNRSQTGVHSPLDPGDQKSSFERHNYFISFPFDVKLGEIFGFGQVGVHWRILYYDGLGRAKEGFFAERTTNWYMLDDTDSILHANQGYMLQLSPSAVNESNGTTWAHGLEQIELYFPSLYPISAIKLDNVTLPALGDEYRCTKNLSSLYDGDPEADRRVKDSYWRCIGVPGFTSKTESSGSWTNFNWTAKEDSLPFLYEWVKTDNKLRVVSSASFTFQPMHAYLVQNKNAIVWTGVAKPVLAALAPRKATKAEQENYEFRLELNHSDVLLDQTYIRLTDKENVTTNFDFGQDLIKELNTGNSNLYTLIGYEKAAANSLPISNQATVIPVGVQIAEDGEYTFSMPDGTSGIGVTLIDNETGERTSLSALDYTINLTAGSYENRFVLEISPINETPTSIEPSVSVTPHAEARKVCIDGILYIVREGKIYDARGTRVE